MNNMIKLLEDVVVNLVNNYDIYVSFVNVYMVVLVIVDYVNDFVGDGDKMMYVIGEFGLKGVMLEKGFKFDECIFRFVIVGLDYDVIYYKFEFVMLVIKWGVKFIGINVDINFLNEWGLVLGVGLVIVMVEWVI